MDHITEMFIGFLIVDGMIFLPMILFGIVGYCVCRYKLKKVTKELEDNGYGR